MSKKSDIKILVVNHKPAYTPNNPLLAPIQVGVALSGKKLDNMVYYDNEGDNISDRNRSYCEITAVYWAWKNLDVDYYGLFHYRRYLSFSPQHEESDRAGRTFTDVASALSEIDLSEDKMRRVIESSDLIVPKMDDTKQTTRDDSLYEQYKNEHYIKDLDYCLNYVREHHPVIAPYTDSIYSNKAYFCNMFIMRKELFNEYCEFMFDVLESFEKHNDISMYSINQYRVTGFLAERLTNIFIQYIIGLGKYRVRELEIAFFENTDPQTVLTPIVSRNNVAVVLAANNYYIPYISTLIGSIAKHSSEKYTYDITVFHRDITPGSMSILRGEFSDHKNIQIRFYDISSRHEQYKNLFTRGHFAIETYFRLFIQDIMLEYNKVLYLDGDMIVNHDIAELYQTDINGYLMAAALDPDTAGLYNGFEPQKKEYTDNVLKLKKPYEYFQAGVILFNLDEMRKTLHVDELFAFASSYNWELLDQDVLNYIGQGKVKFIDMAWNVMYDWRHIRLTNIVSLAPIQHYLSYVEARKNPKIIHYAGPEKPWNDPECDYAPLYWEVARKSVFYEVIIARMGDWRVKHVSNSKGLSVSRRVVIKSRHLADKYAPKGTYRRKPITAASVAIKKVFRRRHAS